MFVSAPGLSPYWSSVVASSSMNGVSGDPLNLTTPAALYRQELLALSDTLRVAKAAGSLRVSHPPAGMAAAALQSLQNSNLLITDLVYPSVIPLPGTLPQTPGHAMSPGSRSKSPGERTRASTPESPRSSDSRSGSPQERRSFILPPPPLVRSSELKFGIDRILNEGESIEESDKEELLRDKILSSPTFPPVLAPCPCSAPSCTLVFSPLAYHHPAHPHHTSPSHHGTALNPHSGAFSGYSGHRAADFPGPYALLAASESGSSHHHHHHHHHSGGHAGGQQQAKRKRSWSRAVFSNLQRKGLEKRFEIQKYVTKPDRRQLAAMLGLTDAQVKVWFQNRRMKWRHQEEAKRKREEEDKKSDVDGDTTTPSHTDNPSDTPHHHDDPCDMVMEDDDDSDIDVDDDEDHHGKPFLIMNEESRESIPKDLHFESGSDSHRQAIISVPRPHSLQTADNKDEDFIGHKIMKIGDE